MNEKANLNYIDQIAGDDQEFRSKFITILQEEFPLEKDTYRGNLQRKEYQKASENVHKIKHKINVLGLHQSHTLAVRHESELRNNNNTLSEEFEAVLEYIAAYLKTI